MDLVDRFEATYDFPFDPFQRRACGSLVDGSSVLVAAPTGAGKTVVGEFAAWFALHEGGKTFYTTPIKALSNQKYGDFVGLHGADNVGLLTGDNSVNGDAPVVVMTTEVLRNMIYEDSPTLQGLRYVVLDEVHYLQDRYRGAVWEEILIHLPVDVHIVSLSATVSNTQEFAEWLQTLRGRTEVVIEEKRPVEVRHWYFASDELLPMFVQKPNGDQVPNPRALEFDRRKRRGPARPNRGGRRERDKKPRIPFRTEVVERLNGEGMLPAIYFIFSRRGCDEAVKRCLHENLRLTTPDERRRITEYADMRASELLEEELDILGYHEWIAGLANGITAHHAGMIPPFKETVEELFKQGLVKVVFATETLALGINMPARTVVIESLTKFTGEKHELMTPGEYTQLSGRAGRRGKDELGHSVVLMQRFTPFETISRLAAARSYPLTSSFQPSYNMAVNMVRSYGREEAEHLVNSSFAQFQADRDVVQLERNRERDEAYLASYRERMTCEKGDIEEYRELVASLKRLESGTGSSRGQPLDPALGSLRSGDVFEIPSGKRRGRYVVIEPMSQGDGAPKLVAMSESRALIRLGPTDFRRPPKIVGSLRIPNNFKAKDAGTRRHLARKLIALETEEEPLDTQGNDAVDDLRRRVEGHPVHSCPDRGRHLHFAERAVRLEKDIMGISRRISRRTGTLARRFDIVVDALEDLGYIKDWHLEAKGELLTGVYNESDLLVVEALQEGVLDDLHGPEVAAVCSSLVYETRGPEPAAPPSWPTDASRAAWIRLVALFDRIEKQEHSRGLDLTRAPDPGFAEKAYRWTAGAPLDQILEENDAPGDFVRSVKQLVDLLRQLEAIAPTEELRAAILEATGGLHRGVVAYSSLEVW